MNLMDWLETCPKSLLSELLRWNQVFSCPMGPCESSKRSPKNPPTPPLIWYSCDFTNLLPRPLVCRKQVLRRERGLAEARLEVPELGIPGALA